jgi:hypothetical protein
MYTECRHIMPTGRRCHSPALRGMAYCYCHQKLHKTLNASKHAHKRLKISSVEDSQGVLLAISQVFEALGKARIDDRTAGVFMYGLQIATQLAINSAKTDPSQCVQDVCLAPDGTLIAADQPQQLLDDCTPPSSTIVNNPKLFP